MIEDSRREERARSQAQREERQIGGVGELQNAVLNFMASARAVYNSGFSEINQIQSRNSDYRVRNLIYLRVIVVPFVLRYCISAGRRKRLRYRRCFAHAGMNLDDPSRPRGNLSNCMLVIVVTARPAIIVAKSQSALPFSRP